MKINKIKKAMGLGQIFGIIIVAIVAAFIINKIRTNMSKAAETSAATEKKMDSLFEKVKGDD